MKTRRVSQKVFARATVPVAFAHDPFARWWGAAAALPLIVMVTAQLMSFDTFIVLLYEYFPLSGAVIGAALVVVTVGAIPALLGMALSPAAQVVSMVAGWVTGVTWLVWAVLTVDQSIETTGHLGTLVATPSGSGAVLFGVILLVGIAGAQWRLYGK